MHVNPWALRSESIPYALCCVGGKESSARTDVAIRSVTQWKQVIAMATGEYYGGHKLTSKTQRALCCRNHIYKLACGVDFLPMYAEVKWSEGAQSCPTLCDPMDCSLPGSSVHGIFQARVPEWVAISFSRGSSQPRDQTQVSRTTGRRFTVWATRKAPYVHYYSIKIIIFSCL